MKTKTKPRVIKGHITPSASQSRHIVASDASCNEKFATYACVDTNGHWRMVIREWVSSNWPYRHVNLTEFWGMYNGLEVMLTSPIITDEALTVYTDNTNAARVARAWMSGRNVLPTSWYTTSNGKNRRLKEQLLVARGQFNGYNTFRPVDIQWVSRTVQYPP